MKNILFYVEEVPVLCRKIVGIDSRMSYSPDKHYGALRKGNRCGFFAEYDFQEVR